MVTRTTVPRALTGVLAAASLTETFTELAEEFEAEHPGVRVRLAFDSSATLAQQALEGAPADALVALAEELDADLLVVGSVGMNSMVGRLVGSVPRLVRKRAKTEVLIVETD